MRLGPHVRLEQASDEAMLFHYLPRAGMADLPPLSLHPLIGVILAYLDRGWGADRIETHLVAQLQAEPEAIREIIGDVRVVFRAHFGHDGSESYVNLGDPDEALASVARRDNGTARYRSRQLLFRNDRAPFPVTMEWVVTRFCNRACVYCYQGAILGAKAADSSLSAERVCDILTEARRMGACNYFITGGEPLLRPDSYDILVHALRLGMKPDIISKQFIKADDARRLAEAGLTKITLSIDSLDPAVAHKMTGIATYAERITQTIQHLVANGIEVTSKMVLTPINFKSLQATIDGLQQLGVRSLTVEPYGDNLKRHSDALRINDRQLDTSKTIVEEFKKRPDRTMRIGIELHGGDDHKDGHGKDGFTCHVGTHALLFGPDGRVGKCDKELPGEEFILGDLTRQSVHEVWNSQIMIDALKPPRELYKGSLCYDCGDFDICHERARCHYDAYLTSGTLYGPGSNCPYLETTVKHVC